ncbi:hypothetical protein BKA62DRAFT_495692 [Auriculariales sp. MPI-PUGE-AT-0066]|nr:hypothetical protein BKA62DRAFT_495692 [Auriculariales sp. MPI-PUGE-AT-0066]
MSRLSFLGSNNSVDPSPSTKHSFASDTSGIALTLKLRSFATNAQATPLLFSTTPLAGKVKLELLQPLKASAIVLVIRGFERGALKWSCIASHTHTNLCLGTLAEAFPAPSTFNHANERNFLEQKTVLWSASQTASRRLEGRTHRFSFRETLPATIPSRDDHQLPLPPTFTSDNCPVFVLYELAVVVQRGLLQRDERVCTPLRIVTRTLPSPASLHRQRAYEQGTALPGPHVDGSGWLTKAISLHFRTSRQHTELRCQCAVATPPTHPRGFAIPLWMTLHSPNPQVLASLCDAFLVGGVSASLARTICWHRDARPVSAAPDITVARAAFWRVSSPDPSKCMLQGELTPPAALPPSFSASSFELGYRISFSFHSQALRELGIHYEDIPIVLPVQITSNATATRPRSYAP